MKTVHVLDKLAEVRRKGPGKVTTSEWQWLLALAEREDTIVPYLRRKLLEAQARIDELEAQAELKRQP